VGNEPNHAAWAALLIEAVCKPGLLHQAYQAFHNYSLGNQLLAIVQCEQRQLTPGPLHTYRGWEDLGRHVRKGERALRLCMPVTSKRVTQGRIESAPEAKEGNQESDTQGYTRFVYRPHWFVLSQTDGQPYQLPPIPSWEKDRALASLGVTEVPFAMLNGNTQGYATRRSLAINPVAALPHKTLFHELAHITLGHTLDETFQEGALPKHLIEAEAESVALLLLETLGLEGATYSRGYLQHWLQGDTIPERSAQRILKAADQILKAGACNPSL